MHNNQKTVGEFCTILTTGFLFIEGKLFFNFSNHSEGATDVKEHWTSKHITVGKVIQNTDKHFTMLTNNLKC